jgi:hypothetical protein
MLEFAEGLGASPFGERERAMDSGTEKGETAAVVDGPAIRVDL